MIYNRINILFYRLNNQNGVALLLVMSSIALLTWLLADFTFESNVNKIKTYNAQDRLQAQLNAQAGLNFALAELRLYKEARNLLEKNESVKNFIQPRKIEQIILMPFLYPIPLPANANLTQRNAIQEFIKETFVRGEISVSITSVKGFLNPNNLRFSPITDNPKQRTPQNPNDNFENDREDNEENKKKSIQQSTEEKLIAMLRDTLEKEREEDDIFDDLYGTLDPTLLVKSLKYYVNNPNMFKDPEKNTIERMYDDIGIIPKHAPLNSLDELHLLAGWPDDIIDLVKNRLSVHEVSVIVINEINEDQLKVIFPEFDLTQIEEFFKYRDGDPELGEGPNPFESEADFKNFLIGNLGLPETDYDDRVNELADAGLSFGIVGNLYKVVSKGTFERASYQLTAFIKIPEKPRPKPKKNSPTAQRRRGSPSSKPPPQNSSREKEKKEPPPKEFMGPRIVELRLG